MAFEGPMVVEFDEELHFNRYRAATLSVSWEQTLPWRQAYLRHCADHEAECLAAGRWGKRWTNDSCDRMFSGGPAGDLNGDGAPRWKQRALYDAMKDGVAHAGMGVELVRLSVYDDVAGQQLGVALESTASLPSRALLGLLAQRLS